jgi:hypothetical protein
MFTANLLRRQTRSLLSGGLIRLPHSARTLTTTADASALITPVPEAMDEEFTVALHSEYFQSYRCDTPRLTMQVTKNSLIEMYKIMVTMRRMEMAADQVSLFIIFRPNRISFQSVLNDADD